VQAVRKNPFHFFSKMLTSEQLYWISKYIGWSRAPSCVIDNGVKIYLEDMPAAMHSMHPAFELRWGTHFIQRAHTQFERMNARNQFNAMDEYLKEDPTRAEFLIWHVLVSTHIYGAWGWSLRRNTSIRLL
jgi:hypothetical protein